MRVLIDLQPLQTISRHRGIGRYTKDLLEQLVPLLNAAGIETLAFADAGLSKPEWSGPIVYFERGSFPQESPESTLILETFLSAQRPDWVFIPSPIDAGVSVDVNRVPARIATICYDLIPLLFADRYLTQPLHRQRYEAGLDTIRRADLILGISEATCEDTLRLLKLPPERVINIGAGVSPFFRPLDPTEQAQAGAALQKQYGLEPGHFILYTGGDDWRKNIDGLIRGFARLPQSYRRKQRLVIACKLRPEVATELLELARQEGIADRLVLTGFIPDESLRALYSLCSLFTFPSHYEGFGLPVLEAMACGAAVCTADNSSLREIVPNPEQRYNASSPDAIAACLERFLGETPLRQQLRTLALTEAKQWSWEAAARRAADAFLRLAASTTTPPALSLAGTRLATPTVAHVSLLPPSRSGIADYSAELLPHLKLQLSLTALTQDERPSQEGTSLVLRQLGNTPACGLMYADLKRTAGITVLHDYGLGSMLHSISTVHPEWGVRFAEELRHQGGTGLASEVQAKLTSGAWQLGALNERGIFVNRRIFTRSLGVIVHSEWARVQAQREHGDLCPVTVIPHQMALPPPSPEEPAALRARLDLPQDALLVVAPGFLAETKRSVPLLDAFAQLRAQCPQSYLVYVGSAEFFPGGSLEPEVRKRGLESSVRVTGYVLQDTLEDYLRAADIGVALRYPFGGETSGSVLRLLAHGIPLIVTQIGSFAELPERVALSICPPTAGDEVQELLAGLLALAGDPTKRHALSQAAREWVAQACNPESCAHQYAAFVHEIAALPETRQKLAADAAARTVAHWGSASPALWELLRGALG